MWAIRVCPSSMRCRIAATAASKFCTTMRQSSRPTRLRLMATAGVVGGQRHDVGIRQGPPRDHDAVHMMGDEQVEGLAVPFGALGRSHEQVQPVLAHALLDPPDEPAPERARVRQEKPDGLRSAAGQVLGHRVRAVLEGRGRREHGVPFAQARRSASRGARATPWRGRLWPSPRCRRW